MISLTQRYQRLCQQGDFVADSAQGQAVTHLDRCYQQLLNSHQGYRRTLRRFRPATQGVYLWGGVGRGKTWLMDLFYHSLPFSEKKRLHFHRFMAFIHQQLSHYQQHNQKNPLQKIAKDFAEQTQVLCFDEFFVSDVTDALILAQLLTALLAQKITLIATSNIAPNDLYKNGVQRQLFLPAIDLINNHCTVHQLASTVDYRLRVLAQAQIYYTPINAANQTALAQRYQALTGVCPKPNTISLNNRPVNTQADNDEVLWCDFAELCQQPRSALDYIELSKLYHTLLLSDMPHLQEANNDAARRFISLIDECYDRRVKLIICAEQPITQLYSGKQLAFEFARTYSRLQEMQSHDYLAQAHLP